MILKKCSGVLLLILFAVFTFGNEAVYADDKLAPTVFIDGSQLTFEANPFIDNGSTLVPFRAIFEKLGLTVKWDGASQTLTGSNKIFLVTSYAGEAGSRMDIAPSNKCKLPI